MSHYVTQLFSGVLAFRKKSTLKKNMWLHKALCPGLHHLLVAFIVCFTSNTRDMLGLFLCLKTAKLRPVL